MDAFLYLLAVLLIVTGVAGTVIPAIPGLPLIFAGGWILGAASDYQLVGVSSVVILALLTAIGVAIEFLAQILGAKKAGATKAGLWGAVIGMVLGLVTGIWGLVFFPLIGAVAGEILAGRDMMKAGAVGIATWIGMAVGLGVKLALAFTMTGMILVSAVVNSGLTGFFHDAEEELLAKPTKVPQGPGVAAPLETYPGKPSGGFRLIRPKKPAAPKPSPSAEAAAPAETAVPAAVPQETPAVQNASPEHQNQSSGQPHEAGSEPKHEQAAPAASPGVSI